MIRSLIYLTGLVTLGAIGLAVAVAYKVHTWPWGEYIREGREVVASKLDPTNAPAPREYREPGRSDAPCPVEAARPQVRHLVRRGETLYEIAGRYYGDGERWPLLARANRIRRPGDLKVGLALVVPRIDDGGVDRTWVPELRLRFSPAGGNTNEEIVP